MKYVSLMRIRHWIKNILIFFPLVFSGNLLEQEKCIGTILGFVSFCLVSSAIYIVNDLRDIDSDRMHEVKKNRPLAQGTVSKVQGMVLIALLLVSAAGICVWNRLGWIYVIIYLFINLLYSFGMKNIPIIDVVILGAGYIIRLLYGGVLAGTGVSDWMLLTVMMASFFLVFGKRRGEYIEYGEETRRSLKGYSRSFLDNCVNMFLTLTIIFYSLTCLDKESGVARQGVNMLWTVPFVIIICLRYMMRMESDDNCGGDPVEIVIHDPVLMVFMLFYGIAVLVSLYGNYF